MPLAPRKELPLLREIQLEVVNRCNYHCALCRTLLEDWVPRRHIRLAEVRRIVTSVAETLRSVTLYGTRGEPLLHPDFPAIVALAKSLTRAEVVTSTNGSLLSPKIAAELLDAGLDRVIFAMDGIHEESYLRYRKGGDFGKVVANLKSFCELKHRGNYRTKILLQFIPMAGNEADIPRLAQWGYGLGVDLVRLKHSSSVGRSPVHRTSEGDFRAEADRAAAFLCPYGGDKLYIDPNGYCYPCCYAEGHRSLLIGNALTENLQDIWYKPAMETLRTSFETQHNFNRFCLETCRDSGRLRIKKILPRPMPAGKQPEI